MKKFSLVVGLAFLFGQISLAQIVTPELINFTQLANFEKAHPELYKRCATCHDQSLERIPSRAALREFAPENNEIKTSESPAKDDEPVTSSTGIAEAATPEIDTKVDDEEVDKW